MRKELSNLSPQQMEWLEEYCANDMQKLKKISYIAFQGYNIPNFEHDELYDDAMNVLMESVIDYDASKNAKFETYLTNNIKKSVIDWYRDNYQRGKRRNLLRDKNGKIIKFDQYGNITDDDKGKPVVVPNTSFDAPIIDNGNVSLSEKIPSNFDIYEEVCGEHFEGTNVEQYMNRLSELQKSIVKMLYIGYSVRDIQNKLHITKKEYDNNYAAITCYENKRILTRKTYKKHVM